MENELEKRRYQTQKMDALERLAGGIAHDLNNILGVIEGYAVFILKAMSAGDPVRPDVEEILRAEQRAAALTKQLAMFSCGKGVRTAIIDVNEFIAKLVSNVKRLIGEDVVLEIFAAPDLRPFPADACRLEQALINLLVNSGDAMSGGGRIKVSIENADLGRSMPKCPRPVEPGTQFVRISVSDPGAGMSADTLGRLFEPYFTTKPKGKGKGLGLAAVYGIVNRHNGWLEVWSEQGTGSVFTIYLPGVAAVRSV
ncbi:MAG: hypothetical protein A2270_00135 [Elusimicrobia bacterium RIFOXYA12_FULL_51_18]|nr:MAG: hypothetical protein A2270_00135 [Elusimicrobia bacterium RIFOXYA12_FULL_51_18]OGS32331.1 MAG: hypothetical protein A2218_02965 [Elusimicrobia bacterium RIFOXYA2_FULL_53_38]